MMEPFLTSQSFPSPGRGFVGWGSAWRLSGIAHESPPQITLCGWRAQVRVFPLG